MKTSTSTSKGKYNKSMMLKSVRDYLEELDRELLKIKTAEPEAKESKVSTTDPNSDYMVRDGRGCPEFCVICFPIKLKNFLQTVWRICSTLPSNP